jgi:hypothetical protein
MRVAGGDGWGAERRTRNERISATVRCLESQNPLANWLMKEVKSSMFRIGAVVLPSQFAEQGRQAGVGDPVRRDASIDRHVEVAADV